MCLYESVCYKNDDVMCLLLCNVVDVNVCNMEGVSFFMMIFDCK